METDRTHQAWCDVQEHERNGITGCASKPLIDTPAAVAYRSSRLGRPGVQVDGWLTETGVLRLADLVRG